MAVWAVSLSTTDLSTRRLAADLHSPVFVVWLGLVRLAPPQPIPCSTPGGEPSTLYLNRFRGEPAISEFDWPFPPNHRSSPTFATAVSSVLHDVLPSLQPAHG